MFDREKTMCFSGKKKVKLSKNSQRLDDIRAVILKEIEKAVSDGIDTFIYGACDWFDLFCAQNVLLFRKLDVNLEKKIKLVAVIPFAERHLRWRQYRQKTHFEVLAECNEIIILNHYIATAHYFERDRFMIKNSSRMICYFDVSECGKGYAVVCAEKMGTSVINLYDKVN